MATRVSPLWAFAPKIAPQEGTVEASAHLDQVAASIEPAPGAKPVAVALQLNAIRTAQTAAPLSGTLTADIRSTHLPLAIDNATPCACTSCAASSPNSRPAANVLANAPTTAVG